MKVDVPPGCKSDPPQCLQPSGIAASELLRQQLREKHGIEIKDAVGEEAAGLAPDPLFFFGLKAQLAEVGVGDGTVQLIVVLAAVEGMLHVPTQWRRELQSTAPC